MIFGEKDFWEVHRLFCRGLGLGEAILQVVKEKENVDIQKS